jgi:hypothetical protein
MNLADHPNEVVVTRNDDEAKALLFKLGVLEKLVQGGAPPGLLSRQEIRLDIWDHRTHWITAIYFIGFEKAEDNGLTVRCLPKSMISLEQFKLQYEAEKHQEFPDGYEETPTGGN